MNGRICGTVFAAAVGLVSGVSVAGTGSELLYDIDFSSPFHTGGAAVSLDIGVTPRAGFSGYFNTAPADEPVMDDVFALRAISGGVSRFDNNAQALMQVVNGGVSSYPIPNSVYDEYILEFDAIVPEFGGLTVFFDAPSISRVSFRGATLGSTNGAVLYNVFANEVQLATYTFGEFLSIRIVFSIFDQNWSIEVDGEVLYDGPLQSPATSLKDVRFSVGNPVILDNITLVGRDIGTCGVADLNNDGLLDLSDVTTFISSFLDGCP